MKHALSIIRLSVFLALCYALFKTAFTAFYLFSYSFRYQSIVEYIAILTVAVIGTMIVGTAIFGFLALLIGRVNPYPIFGKFFAIPVILFCMYFAVKNIYETFEYQRGFEGIQLITFGIICLAMLYLAFKLYRLLDYHRLTYQ